MTWPKMTDLIGSTILVYLKLLTLDRFRICGEKKDDKTRQTKHFSVKARCFT